MSVAQIRYCRLTCCGDVNAEVPLVGNSIASDARAMTCASVSVCAFGPTEEASMMIRGGVQSLPCWAPIRHRARKEMKLCHRVAGRAAVAGTALVTVKLTAAKGIKNAHKRALSSLELQTLQEFKCAICRQ